MYINVEYIAPHQNKLLSFPSLIHWFSLWLCWFWWFTYKGALHYLVLNLWLLWSTLIFSTCSVKPFYLSALCVQHATIWIEIFGVEIGSFATTGLRNWNYVTKASCEAYNRIIKKTFIFYELLIALWIESLFVCWLNKTCTGTV